MSATSWTLIDESPQGWTPVEELPVAPLPKELQSKPGELPAIMKPNATAQAVRQATSTLPAIGGISGGLASSPTVVGAAAGAGLGTGIGIEAKQLLNRALFGSDEPATTSSTGLKELGAGMATSAATAAALQGTQNFLLGRAAQIPANQDWQDLNEAVGATQNSIRMSKDAGSLGDAATMPGRGLANVGFDVDTLKNLDPVERMAAIAPHYKAAGQAIDMTVQDATKAGTTLDVGNSAFDVLKSIKNPKLQDQAIDSFNSLSQEIGIANQRAATPAEARQLRQALQSGARFGPAGDLSSLGGIRAQLYRAVSGDLHDAVPGLGDLDQHYSDMRAAIDAAQRGAARFAMKSVPAPEPAPPSAIASAAKTVAKRVLPYAVGSGVGGAIATGVLKHMLGEGNGP